ncbi:SIS domain-containing protein [Candidatus Pelagibacter sp.]|nr:SIS domain-containing protein [Candidatus Pelagibacter sp.]
MSKIVSDLKNQLEQNIIAHQDIINMSDNIIEIIEIIKKKLEKGGKILFCGNGGSAADAQHLAAEFIVRLRPHINRKPLSALTLAQDTSTITACGNDYSFDDIFLRSFQALAQKNDILFCITTSGNSKNILKVLAEAKKKKILSIGLLGKKGGKAKKLCDKKLIVSSENTARIQECHIFLGHFILEKVEDLIINKKK